MPRKKGPQVNTAYNYIKDHILTFDYLPGVELSSYKVDEQLQMSRTPINEAIQRLLYDGLLEMKDEKVIIAPMTSHDIIEICQVRKAIELAVIEILFSEDLVTDDLVEELRINLDKMKEATTYDRLYKYDDRFHNALMHRIDNRRMLEISERMCIQITRVRWLHVFIQSGMRKTVQEHQAVYDAFVARDFQAAHEAMAAHLNNAQRNFEYVLNNPTYSPKMLNGIATILSSVE